MYASVVGFEGNRPSISSLSGQLGEDPAVFKDAQTID